LRNVPALSPAKVWSLSLNATWTTFFDLFSTKSGTFNYELLNKVRKVEVDPKTGDEIVTYALWDDVDGKTVYRLQETDLIQLKGKPQSVLDVDGMKIPVTDGIPLNTSNMGYDGSFVCTTYP
jgi:hypothetical protein